MRKIWNIVFVAFAAAAFTVACTKASELDVTKEEVPQGEQKEGHQARPMTITATIPADIATKVTFTPDVASGKPSKMTFTWEATETLRVYDHADHGVYVDFDLESSEANVATFYCDDASAIAGASSYDVVVLDGKSMGDYNTQTQAEDNDTSHLKYISGKEDITVLTSIEFDVASSILAITAKMPGTTEAQTITSIDIKASENIFNSSNTLTINLDMNSTDDAILNFYANLPGTQAVPAGTTLLVHFNADGASHDVYTRYIELGTTEFTAGKLNTININATNGASYANASTTNIGSSTNPYLIGDKYQLQAISLSTTKQYYKLVDDIDLDGVTWTSLNPVDPGTKVIDLDGNGKTISHLSKPLFDDLNGKVINLVLEDATVDGGSSITGILANTIKTAASTVTNVDVVGTITTPYYSSSITATAYAGGLIGQINSGNTIITDCDIINTNVSGTLAGGVVGFANALVTMSGCKYSGGTVSASARYCGGMLGSTGNFSSIISDCHVENATITSTSDRVGGFVGQAQTSVSISSCSVNGGSVHAGTINVGGFAGVGYGPISNSYVDGTTVSSGNTTNNTELGLGGFVGYFSGTLTSCKSNVNIDQTGSYIGGLVGNMVTSGSISECFASGNVIGGYRKVGGLVGGIQKAGTFSIQNSYSTGNVQANSYVGGLIGEVLSNITSVTISNCYSSGTVRSTSFGAGGLLGFISAGGTTVQHCAAWNSSVIGDSHGVENWSTGAVVGVAFPICTLTDNYRNPSMSLTAWWDLSDEGMTTYQHPNVATTSHPLVVKSISDGTLAETTATSTASGQPNRPQYAYHGKVETGKTLSQLASTTLGWLDTVWNFTGGDLPTLK